jgi:hypothetical protein
MSLYRKKNLNKIRDLEEYKIAKSKRNEKYCNRIVKFKVHTIY